VWVSLPQGRTELAYPSALSVGST